MFYCMFYLTCDRSLSVVVPGMGLHAATVGIDGLCRRWHGFRRDAGRTANYDVPTRLDARRQQQQQQQPRGTIENELYGARVIADRRLGRAGVVINVLIHAEGRTTYVTQRVGVGMCATRPSLTHGAARCEGASIYK